MQSLKAVAYDDKAVGGSTTLAPMNSQFQLMNYVASLAI